MTNHFYSVSLDGYLLRCFATSGEATAGATMYREGARLHQRPFSDDKDACPIVAGPFACSWRVPGGKGEVPTKESAALCGLKFRE
jgi:hypothetical protein